jgi:biopolymer transport protein ExbD
MTDKRRFLDVWIIESNTVYREVPYTVVADWVQQGRLLESDMLRQSGTSEWFPLGSMSAFAAYLPKEEPYRTEDRAEALEPVQVDFAWKPRTDDSDEDVDMIPLIDVSLVLLIFFMMTATVASAGSAINMPSALFGANIKQQLLWIGIDKAADGTPLYSLGQADESPRAEDQKLSKSEVLERLDERLKEGRVDVTIKADQDLPYQVIKELTVALESRRSKGLIRQTFAGVSERENQ